MKNMRTSNGASYPHMWQGPDKKGYEPQIVSFGPYHHYLENLKTMECHKQRALKHFMRRFNQSLDGLYEAVEGDKESLVGSYENLDKQWLDDVKHFLQLMVRDGCFMLEILLTATHYFPAHHREYGDDDPVFGSHGMRYCMPLIRKDMIMMENQIPLLVLKKLILKSMDNITQEKVGEFIQERILKFYGASNEELYQGTEGLHVLDVYRRSLLHSVEPSPRTLFYIYGRLAGEMVRPATYLRDSGIQFKISKTKSLGEISFTDGVLQLPKLEVDDDTESIFLNMRVFERLHPGAGNQVTDYLYFMDCIIASSKDVTLLHSKGIILNSIGSEKAVADTFHRLSQKLIPDPNSHLAPIHYLISRYCGRWQSRLARTYLTSPWSVPTLLAAIFSLSLTAAQTFYSIYGVYKVKP